MPRGQPKRLRVSFNEMTFGPPDRATDVFIDALCAIGLEDVARLNLQQDGTPLVARVVPNKRDSSHAYRSGWYINTHASTPVKHSILIHIAEKLGLKMRVDLIIPQTLADFEKEWRQQETQT
jgi:hypothetical protein